jgi:ssDNA-binding Zn-finger/Zn-ribbon topoisomerase 1
MYDNIGGKIKGSAKIMFIVGAIVEVITGIVLLATDDSLIFAGLLILFLGPILSWVSSWVLYAFGELVEDIHAIRDKEGTTKEVNAKRKAEEKIKREAELKAQQEAVAGARREAEASAQWQQDNEFQESELSDDDFIDTVCPKCGEILSFLKNEVKGICSECGTEFEI